MSKIIGIMLCLLVLLSVLTGCGQTRIVHCDHCGDEIELPVNDKIQEDWIVFCKTCEEELFGDNPVVSPAD